jgi:K+-sensing histidine kinase KdpD
LVEKWEVFLLGKPQKKEEGNRVMKKQTHLLFYVLSAYVFLQFLWWGYHLIQLSYELDPQTVNVNRRVWMIVGEGSVFLLIFGLGLWQINRAIRRELELSTRQNNFLLSVTHELKTPLAANKLTLQTIQKHQLEEQKKNELISKALDENIRLENLIDNILNASRLESKAIQAIKSEINFLDLAKNICDLLHKRHGEKFITLNCDVNVLIHGDRFMLEAIISNLLENAIKYAGKKAKICIYCQKKGNYFVFGVSDEGPGISVGENEHIFKKFYRVGKEETRKTSGSGLGLFIVKEFVTLQNGQIVYRKNQPKGSIFEVTLPL